MPVTNRGKDWVLNCDGNDFAGKVTFNVNVEAGVRRAYNRSQGAMTSILDANGATGTISFLKTDFDSINAWNALSEKHLGGELGTGSCKHIPTGGGGAMEGLSCMPCNLEDDDNGDTVSANWECEHYKPSK